MSQMTNLPATKIRDVERRRIACVNVGSGVPMLRALAPLN